MYATAKNGVVGCGDHIAWWERSRNNSHSCMTGKNHSWLLVLLKIFDDNGEFVPTEDSGESLWLKQHSWYSRTSSPLFCLANRAVDHRGFWDICSDPTWPNRLNLFCWMDSSCICSYVVLNGYESLYFFRSSTLVFGFIIQGRPRSLRRFSIAPLELFVRTVVQLSWKYSTPLTCIKIATMWSVRRSQVGRFIVFKCFVITVFEVLESLF